MTRIYTRTGDEGQTGLFGGGRVRKDDPRVEAYGEVDELNASLGMARAELHDKELDELLGRLQDQLFTLGGLLATPKDSKAFAHVPKLDPSWVTQMEERIDRFDEELPKLTAFILPGGSRAAAALHLSRTVCRRAERRLVALVDDGSVEAACGVYLNRLSDLLFTLARVANARLRVADVPWKPSR